VSNVYFDLTVAFNRHEPTAALASGQAVVFYRVAIMSKDGDWVIRETDRACAHVLAVLSEQGARYRASAPLDPRWLEGGWSSHFEFFDDRRRRIRCDFVSRPPRVPPATIASWFERADHDPLLVVDVEALIRMKQTQHAKDYAVIGALARRLPLAREIELTTDPDRVLELAAQVGPPVTRPALVDAVTRGDRRAVVVALAEEMDAQRRQDQRRVSRYETAAAPFLAECRSLTLSALPLADAHRLVVDIAERLLPRHPLEDADADAQ
jgi:hypothetical protein